jgi:hypothetical protein
MNRFDILLSLLAKVQEDYLGTEISDMGGYGDRAYVEVKLEDGSKLKIDVVLEVAPKEQSNAED